MAAALVAVHEIRNGGGPSQATSIGTVTAGNALILMSAVFNGSAPTMTVTGGGTWTTNFTTSRDATTGYTLASASCPSATGGATTVTVTWSAGGALTAFCMEFSGAATSSILDATGTMTTGFSASEATAALSNVQAAAIMVALVGNDESATGTFSAVSNGWTLPAGSSEGDGSSFIAGAMAYKVVAAAASQSTAFTYGSAKDYIGLIMSYKAATGGGGVTGTAAVTLAQPALALAGAETESSTAAVTLVQPVLSLAGTSGTSVTSTAAVALAQPALALAGAETESSTASVALAQPGLAVVATERFVGTAAVTLAQPGLALAGAESFPSTGAVALAQPGLALAGAESIPSTASVALAQPGLALAATSSSPVTSTAAVALAGLVPSLAGTAATPVTSTGAVSLAGLQLALAATSIGGVVAIPQLAPSAVSTLPQLGLTVTPALFGTALFGAAIFGATGNTPATPTLTTSPASAVPQLV